MSYKKTFLQLPLYSQIYFSIILMIVLTIGLIIFISETISSSFIIYLKSTKKKYFMDMQKSIIESNIFFMNLCLLQYENLIDLFNYQFFLYFQDEEILKEFAIINNKPVDENKIEIINNLVINNISSLLYNNSDKQQILYIFYYTNDNFFIENVLLPLIRANYMSFKTQIEEIENFRIPFYGDIALLKEYIILFTKYKAFISLNYSNILNMYQEYEGNIDAILDFIVAKRDSNFNFYKKYFEDFENNKISFLDIIFNLRYDIFYEYTQKDELYKEDYIKQQSIFFQNIEYENNSSWFFDNWFTGAPRYQGTNKLIGSYIDFLLFHISSKIDTYSIPFNHETNEVISKNLCYYCVLKQIINFYILSDKKLEEFNQNFIDEIYEKITKKEKISLNDCKLETYYSEKIGPQININNEFSVFYDLKYKFNTYAYLLRDEDIDSIIFITKYSYPNFVALKDFYPNFFTFKQLDFYSFSFGNEISKMIDSSNHFYKIVRYVMILALWLIWIIFTFVILFISSKSIKQITEPIIQLTEIIDLNNINEKSINEDIFEYKSDDEINEFFILCKKLINGEIQENNYKKIENSEINNKVNNNMIINNKMILELIENQKSLNNDDKEIFLLKQGNLNNNRNKKKINSSSSNLYSKDKNSQGLDLIKLTSLGHNESKLITSSQDLYSNVDENDADFFNMKCYDNLLNLTDYIYNWREKDKINGRNKLRMNLNHNSVTNKNLLKFESVSLNDKIDNENKRKDCKYITYLWYSNAKKNKLFGKN